MVFYEWTVIVGLFLGATIGSFLNVVIYRMPRGLSLSNPKYSFCPNCKNRLTGPDLFPLLSWLFLRGRCRHCKAPVAARYFIVELLNGCIWAGIWWQYLVVNFDVARAVAYALASAALVAVIFIDWEFYIIPDQINAFLLFVGLGYNVYLYSIHSPLAATKFGLPSSVAGALLGFAILWLITLLGRVVFGKDAMGHGDIKMARGIGAVLFPVMATISFALAILFGVVLGVTQILLRARAERLNPSQAEEEDEEPYEPESIGSIVKCGLGYLLLFDVIGLAFPKFAISWFGEDPYEPVVSESGEQIDFEVERTMIPFGPYLALGAIAATVFEAQLRGGLDAYWKWAGGGPGILEHLFMGPRL